jgi:hypothetical protein
MNAPHRPEPDRNVDVIANDWLDDLLSSPIPSDLTRQQYERLADFRLLDSMLLHLLHEATPADVSHSSAPATTSLSSAGASPAPAFVLFGNQGGDSARWGLEGMPFAYLVATMVVAVGLLIASLVHVSISDPNTDRTPTLVKQSLPLQDRQPQLQFVGRITGMVDCRWADPETEAILGSHVPLGRRYALTSGLLEISYDSGAKVILQGPVTYEIDSPAGGFLSIGRLTARLEKKSEVRGQRSELANQKSEIRNQQFAVTTPSATVTDLGTEFGVEVDQSGATWSRVFRGKVKIAVRPSADARQQQSPVEKGEIILGANQSAHVRRGEDAESRLVVVREPIPPSVTFTRRLPKYIPIQLFNTGAGLNEGDPDPHWQIVAASNDPKFKPQPAVVTSATPNGWLANDSRRSQWISTAANVWSQPNGVVYTFRTRFELAEAPPEGILVRGWFVVDNHIRAIRFNGREVSVPEHPHDGSYAAFHHFAISQGFVPGANTLEIEVDNGTPGCREPDSPMAIRVELNGTIRKTAEEDATVPGTGKSP